jgi:hypothetical protein
MVKNEFKAKIYIVYRDIENWSIKKATKLVDAETKKYGIKE